LFEQNGGKAFWVQNLINKAITSGQRWVLTTFPFGALRNDPGTSLFWHINNTRIQVGRNGIFGVRLYHYMTKEIHNRMQLSKKHMIYEVIYCFQIEQFQSLLIPTYFCTIEHVFGATL
jgi:hypothetical protein